MNRRKFDNLTTCVWLVYSCHGRLFDQRLRESGLTIKEFIEQETKANLNVYDQLQSTRTDRSHQLAGR